MNTDAPDLLTVHEVATQLRVDDSTVRRWIRQGTLAAVTLPHRGTRQTYRIRRTTLDALLALPEPLAEFAYEQEPLIPRVIPALVVRRVARLAH